MLKIDPTSTFTYITGFATEALQAIMQKNVIGSPVKVHSKEELLSRKSISELSRSSLDEVYKFLDDLASHFAQLKSSFVDNFQKPIDELVKQLVQDLNSGVLLKTLMRKSQKGSVIEFDPITVLGTQLNVSIDLGQSNSKPKLIFRDSKEKFQFEFSNGSSKSVNVNYLTKYFDVNDVEFRENAVSALIDRASAYI